MKYAIIAAGNGSRLAQEGIQVPKPLVSVQGEPLVDRLIRIFMANGATEICVVCNAMMPEVADHLRQIRLDGLYGEAVPLNVMVKTTPSSMHSLYALSPMLGHEWFCATTVDTIFDEAEFAEYIRVLRGLSDASAPGPVSRLSCPSWTGLMGVTGWVDDERPLYVGADDGDTITGFYDAPHETAGWVSAGIYGLHPECIGTLGACVRRGERRMRNFQRALVAEGHRLRAYPFTKVLDIDHAADIAKAEEFISSHHAR